MAKPTLEVLPGELLILILLEIPDLNSIKSAVLSSRQIHSAYQLSRHEILRGVVKAKFQPPFNFPEALLAVRSNGLDFVTSKEEALALLDTWRRRDEIKRLSLESKAGSSLDQARNIEESIKLLRLHQELCFFLDDYSKNAPQPSWMYHDQWRNKLPLKMSHEEKSRFLRSLCRLYTNANLFGPVKKASNSDVESDFESDAEPDSGEYEPEFDREGAYRAFYGTFPHWEHHEMGCVWIYLTTKYELFYDTNTFCSTAPRPNQSANPDILLDQPPEYAGQVTGLSSWNLPEYRNAFLAYRPKLLYRLLRTDDLQERIEILRSVPEECEHGFIGGDTFIGTGVGLSPGQRYPRIYPADQYEGPYFEERWSVLPTLEQPNLGWKRHCLIPHAPSQSLERSLRFRGFELMKKDCWLWGFAIWDGKRLRDWNAPLEDDIWNPQPPAAPMLLLTAP